MNTLTCKHIAQIAGLIVSAVVHDCPWCRIERLREALFTYGSHFSSCLGRPCDCGFLAAWQEAKLPETIGELILGELAVDAHKGP